MRRQRDSPTPPPPPPSHPFRLSNAIYSPPLPPPPPLVTDMILYVGTICAQ